LKPLLPGTIGVALGSGAARGFAHVGVLRGLAAAGIVPDVVAGVSAGAVVGAVHAAGRLDDFERWARGLDRRKVLALLDVSLSGGALRGRRMIDQIGTFLPDGATIEGLPHPFAAIATDLESGREVWLQRGPLLDAIHASCALPGVVAPVRIDGRWMVDGGVVNPVPVALCRALGADSVIAVDLNAALLTRRFRGESDRPAPSPEAAPEANGGSGSPWAFQNAWSELRRRFAGSESDEGPPSPGLYDVLNNTLEIMQVRITRSRMAGDPPELLVTPRLPDFALLDLYRAGEAIDEGERAAELAVKTLALARGDAGTEDPAAGTEG
jgi:NTE family protein